MKSILSVAFCFALCAIVFTDGQKTYKKIQCSDCVYDFLDKTEIEAVCAEGRTEEQWMKIVDCVTAGGANLKKALKHCWEDADHKGDTRPPNHENPEYYFSYVCRGKPADQSAFNYHCCYQNHALEFSQLSWTDFVALQKTCWASP